MDHHLICARLRVPDLDASVDHLVALLGLRETRRDATSAGLAHPGQPVCLELVAGAAAIESLTLATDPMHLVEVAARAEAHGAPVLERGAERLRLMAPHGVVVELVAGGDAAGGSLDHLSFTARELQAGVRFFCDVLGFRLSDRVGESRYWLRCNANHHTVALFAGEDGLQHYAFAVPDVGALARLGDALAARGGNFLWGIGRHGLGENVFTYHLDPSGAILEVCSDMVQITDEDAWEVGVWAQDSTASAIRWGQLPPPEFRTTIIPSAAGLARA